MFPKQIINALTTVRYPGTGKNLVESGMLEDDIRISGLQVNFSLIFDKDNDPFQKSVIKAAETAVHTYVDEQAIVQIHPKYRKQNMMPTTESVQTLQARHVIAIHSGKGGVGKSTVAANLAVGLAQSGYRVGLLDADIHGPSQPKMFHCEDYKPTAATINGRDLIEPMEQYGVKMLSIGFFLDPNQAVVWRGGMASNALKQLIQDANWGTLDFFLIDLPPGTSDVHLTLVQTLPLTGAIVVTTPQAVATVDARKGVDMFQNEKINVPVLGIIENMSWFTPAELPQNKYYLFGKEGGKILADELGVSLLGQIPISQSVCESGDNGSPIVLQQGHPTAEAFKAICRQLEQLN